MIYPFRTTRNAAVRAEVLSVSPDRGVKLSSFQHVDGIIRPARKKRVPIAPL
jgi:hypothetical protein